MNKSCEYCQYNGAYASIKCQYACVMQSYVPLTESVYLKPEDMPSLHDLIKEMYKYKEMYGM